jgi:hypothetical protein
MSAEPATAAVQRYLSDLAGDKPAEPIVRALLDRSVRPQTVRGFFGLVNQHMPWELNDLARRLVESQPLWSCSPGLCRRRPAAALT